MGDQPLPYEAFGSWILFRKLETGALSELWRAGRIEGTALAGTYSLRRFHGGDQHALRQSALAARGVVRQIEGTTVAREPFTDVAESTAFVAHVYDGGRSLRGVLDRATDPAAPHPLPIDQAVAIAERLAASLQHLHGIKLNGQRLIHGALIPQLVWISEEGEVRVAGHQMAKGILASLADPAVRGEIGAFFAPEVTGGEPPSPAGDIYSVGALLYLMLTGVAPPHGEDESSLREAIASATLAFDEEALPDDIRPILERSLSTDPARRFASFDDLHKALAALVAGGRYAPTTFNLAFYLHTLLRRELEEERQQREQEQSVAVAPYVARQSERSHPPPAPPRSAAPASAAVSPLSAPGEKSKRFSLIAAGAVLVVAAAAAGGYWMLQSRRSAPSAAAQTSAPTTSIASAAEVPKETPMLVAVAEPEADEQQAATATAPNSGQTAADEEAERRAFEEEVNRRLRDEVTRLQADYERQLAAERAKAAPRSEPPRQEPVRESAPPPQATRPVPTATVSDQRLDPDRLNQERLNEIERARTETSTPANSTAAPSPSQPSAEFPVVETATTATQPAPPPPAPAVRHGDLIELGQLDQEPRVTRPASPDYPTLARRQRAEATLILSVLVSENGQVLDVRVLRGDSRRLGFDEAAVRAARSLTFTPPIKDGQRVRTWIAFPVRFALPR